MPTSAVLAARGRAGYAKKTGDPEKIAAAKRELAVAKLEQYIQRVAPDALPLLPHERERFAAFLGGAA